MIDDFVQFTLSKFSCFTLTILWFEFKQIHPFFPNSSAYPVSPLSCLYSLSLLSSLSSLSCLFTLQPLLSQVWRLSTVSTRPQVSQVSLVYKVYPVSPVSLLYCLSSLSTPKPLSSHDSEASSTFPLCVGRFFFIHVGMPDLYGFGLSLVAAEWAARGEIPVWTGFLGCPCGS